MAGAPAIRLAGPGDHAAVAAMIAAMDRHCRPDAEPTPEADAVALMERIAADPRARHAGRPRPA